MVQVGLEKGFVEISVMFCVQVCVHVHGKLWLSFFALWKVWYSVARMVLFEPMFMTVFVAAMCEVC